MYGTVSAQRIPYPKIDRGLVGSINAVVACGEFRFPGEGSSCSVLPSISRGRYDACLVLRFSVGGSTARVRLNPAAVDCLLGDLIAGSDFAALDDDLQLAVLETALAAPLGALTALLRADVVLVSIAGSRVVAGTESERLDGDGAASVGSLHFEVRQPPEVVRCAILVDLDSPLPESVVEYLAESPTGRDRDVGGLPVPVRFELGAASLSSVEFRSLEPGDIILLDQCFVEEGRLRINICDRVFRMGELEGHRLTVQDGF